MLKQTELCKERAPAHHHTSKLTQKHNKIVIFVAIKVNVMDRCYGTAGNSDTSHRSIYVWNFERPLVVIDHIQCENNSYSMGSLLR